MRTALQDAASKEKALEERSAEVQRLKSELATVEEVKTKLAQVEAAKAELETRNEELQGKLSSLSSEITAVRVLR